MCCTTGLFSFSFMQRSRQKEESVKKEEQEQVISPKSGNWKCVVIMEGDPTPGAVIGRMSFQNFNPSIDKLSDEVEDIDDKHSISTTGIADRKGMKSDRDNEVSHSGNDDVNKNRENDDSEDLQSKKLKVEADVQTSYLSPTNSKRHNLGQSSSVEGRKNSQQEYHRLDLKHLRPPTGRKR
uniref:Uncharacterized protein n=1 Tax=Picea sitchensis TaxID=3332 RepID=A9NP18_PICSI|nr:unknown [Picea sitchensis]